MPENAQGLEAAGLLRQRIHWLEKQVMELQHDLGIAEEMNASLRAQFVEATGRSPI
jgi:hypothetical protein